MGNPYCPNDNQLMKKTRSGKYVCPKCKVSYKAGQDAILSKEPKKPISKEDLKLMGTKGTKKSQMSFGQKIEMMRSMRSRKRQKEKLTPSFSPNVEVPEVKAEQIAKDLEDYKATGTITGVNEGIKYRCKDCKETFEGLLAMDKCMFCDSKNIEVI
jgi:Zn finger protein HypA/HybF involved in hydrogenase expression